MKSLWNETATRPDFPTLQGDCKTDVLIIGGGIAGILTAYFLQEKGVPYLLVEKDRICGGTTGNTTAKITYQHGLIYHKLLRNVGLEKARMYLDANRQAFAEYEKLCQKIDCAYEIKNDYVYAVNDRKKLEDEMDALSKIGYPALLAEDLPLPVNTVGAVCFEEQAHFPFINKHGSYFLKLYQHRSYVIALEHAQDVEGMYVDESKTGFSFRNYGDLLLLGGGGHRTGKSGGNWNELRRFADENYPQAIERYHWAAQDCMSLDDIPYIGNYSKHTPNLYVAGGFRKWGMTGAMVSAMLLGDMICGRKNDFAQVFCPSRSILKPQLFVNGFESTKNLLTPTKKRCPHLGCALKWNPIEHSWDCECHGSRFDESGKVLDNPANHRFPLSRF